MSKSQFTIRISEELLNKLIYIAKQNSRTPNKQFEQLIKEDIIEFEKTHDKINLNDKGE